MLILNTYFRPTLGETYLSRYLGMSDIYLLMQEIAALGR